MTDELRSGDRIALAVMARAPSDPQGKTRLASVLGAGADLRRAILLDTLDAVRHVTSGEPVVLFTPLAAEAEFAALTGGGTGREVGLIAQRGDFLGERLANAFADLLARAYAGALVIGSDLPTLPPAHVERAMSALTSQADPVVLGPALDGGYYLIGLRKNHPELFRGIPWSTNEVCDATVEVAHRCGLSISLVPRWYDVDSVDDLRRVVEARGEDSGPGRRTRAWVAARFGLKGPSPP